MSLVGIEAKLAEILMSQVVKHFPKLKDASKDELVNLAVKFLVNKLPADSKAIKVQNSPDVIVITINKAELI